MKFTKFADFRNRIYSSFMLDLFLNICIKLQFFGVSDFKNSFSSNFFISWN